MSDVEIKCERCGTKLEGKNYFTYCSVKKQFFCLHCESICKNYSVDMLPNGTHCKKRYSDELYKYRLLSARILAPDYDVQGAIGKYERLNSAELYEKFRTQAAMYKIIDPDDADKRARYRVELAAMQQVLRKRALADPKLSLWARKFFSEAGETKDE